MRLGPVLLSVSLSLRVPPFFGTNYRGPGRYQPAYGVEERLNLLRNTHIKAQLLRQRHIRSTCIPSPQSYDYRRGGPRQSSRGSIDMRPSLQISRIL
ncbi:hypothetical protein L209DRAFT_757849 [Thermothelomyces heterothallicus CBS 203.75]